MGEFNHYDLKLIIPKFESEITDLIFELNHLRKKTLGGTTHPKIFFQLKHIFHTLESIGSSRIEGNNTTIAEYIETKMEEEHDITNGIKEIMNLEDAMTFIEENIKEYPINKMFIRELHKITVVDLPPPPHGEGDATPGVFRSFPVKISKSAHLPPEAFLIDKYIDELVDFINNDDGSKYDLLKIAIAHHRFVWIHPFGNGNGRTVRLFTYAMLVKAGFNVDTGRILNPTAVFCSDRDEYYKMLSQADLGTEEGILIWATYVLKGLKDEIEKIDKLLDYTYLKKEILLPTIHFALDRKIINDTEASILRVAIEKQIIQADDLKRLFEGKANSEISRQIKRLIDKKMLIAEDEGKRKYILRFDNNYLLRGIIKHLGDKGFLPLKD